MTTQLLTAALNDELRAAGPGLVGNDDLLRSVLSGCGDCIKVLDLDGRLQFMSEGGKRVMEVDDFSKLKGCPWPDFWGEEGSGLAAGAVAKAKAGATARFRGPANTARGTPRYWDVQVSPIFGADGAPSHLLSISRDITEEWTKTRELEEAAQRERFFTQELEHRVKNIFALVLSVAKQSFRGEAHAAPLKAFSARALALAAAHEGTNDSNWTKTSILQIVDRALSSHQSGDKQIYVSGPDVSLTPRQALAMSLALNELATNAVKYGALSQASGRVDVTWSAPPGGGFDFRWQEQGGPLVVAPERTGFGTRIIKEFLAKDFDGEVRLTYAATGFNCELHSPNAKLAA
jgi:two-component sensor histidine kinase